MKQFCAFGQELHLKDSIATIKQAVKEPSKSALREYIVAQLPQSSLETRKRIASKILQRFIPSRKNQIIISPFIRLIDKLDDFSAHREGIFYQLTETDKIVRAIAGEIFYPYFIGGEIPRGFDENSFRLANTGGLFEINKIITKDFVVNYCKKMWNFRSLHSIGLSLRILRQVGLLQKIALRMGKRRKFAYSIAPHFLSLPIFIYCLYYEFLEKKRLVDPLVDRVLDSDFVKVFLLEESQVDKLLVQADKKNFIRYEEKALIKQVSFKYTSVKGIVDQLK